MDAVEPGKMWDCKTSKMPQSPYAALNAFGLFAAGAVGYSSSSASGARSSWQPTLSRNAVT